MIIGGLTIERVSIIDDDPSVRESYVLSVEDLQVTPVNEAGPLGDLSQFTLELSKRAQAAICDFKLRVRNYARFDGAELVARLFDNGFPAVLCTKWDRAGADEFRRFRSRVPSLINPADLDKDVIMAGLEACVREIKGDVSASRRPWRTLVRVEEIDEKRSVAYVVVPAWDRQEVITISLADIPPALRTSLEPDDRLFAQVNLGAESYEELFIEGWEGQR